MRFGLTQKSLTFALAIAAAVPLITSGEIGSGFVAVFTILFVAGWFLTPPLTENLVYRRVVTGVVAAVMGVQLVRLFTGTPMAMLAMELITLLLGAKLCTRARTSDDNQIVILSFLHIIAATVVMTDLLYGAAFLLFVALSSPMLALSYLRQEIEHRFAAKAGQAPDTEMVERLFNSKRIVSLRFLLGSAFLTVPILLITGVLFVVFPRIGFGFMGKISTTKTAVGFGNEVILGDLDTVRMEETVMMRLVPTTPPRHPPAHIEMRIKGAVFDTFDGKRWQKSKDLKWSDLPGEDTSQGTMYYLHSVHDAPSTARYEVFLEPIKPSFIFVPEGTGRILLDPVADRRGINRRRLTANLFGEIQYDDAAGVGIRYLVDLTGAPAIGAPPLPGFRFDTLYPGSDRLEQLARKSAGNGPPREMAARLVRALKSDYRYALNLSKDVRNRDEATALDRFLFSRKTGTCEHFATALTLMLRAVGIPARLITGFSGADWNAIGGFYSVRERFAHSWTEAYIDGRWRPLDATPASGEYWHLNQASAFTLFIDTLRMRWQKHVVSYDLTTQGKIAFNLWKKLRKSRHSGEYSLSPIQKRIATIGIITFIIAAGLVMSLRRRRLEKGLSKPRSRLRADKEAASLVRALDHRLARFGYPRSPNTTPLEHLTALTDTAPFSLESARDILTRYHQVRFGQGVFEDGELKLLMSKIRQIGRDGNSTAG